MMTTWLGFHSCLCCLQLASKFPAQLTFRNAEVESHFLWCHINIRNTHWSSLRIYKEYKTTHVPSSIRFIFRQKINNERTTEERGKFIYVRNYSVSGITRISPTWKWFSRQWSWEFSSNVKCCSVEWILRSCHKLCLFLWEILEVSSLENVGFLITNWFVWMNWSLECNDKVRFYPSFIIILKLDIDLLLKQ